MLRIEIHDPEVEHTLREHSRRLGTEPASMLVSAAAESLGLPVVARRVAQAMGKSTSAATTPGGAR
jgi:hypothetical protein